MTNANENETASDQIEALSRSRLRRDHSHRTAEQVRWDLKIGRFEYLLLWLAKADFHVLSISTYHSRARMQGLGLMVIFTASLAFCTSLYTLMTTLIGPDDPGRWIVGPFLALIYTFGIVIIDREIVGSTTNTWSSMGVRFVFAIFIAFAVSYPAKLKFFEERINAEIQQIIKERNSDAFDRVDQIRSTADQERETALANFQTRIDSKNKEIAVLDKQIAEEQDRGGCGPICQSNRIDKRTQEAELVAIEQARARELDKPVLGQSREEAIAALEAKIDSVSGTDILFKTEALNRITAADPNLRLISYFLLIFFILLELVPLALKWSMGHTEYHYYIEARNNINKQKIASISNLYVKLMQDKDINVLHIPLEITDMIALALEDESRQVDNPSSLRDTLDSASLRTRGRSASAEIEATVARNRPAGETQDPETVSG